MRGRILRPRPGLLPSALDIEIDKGKTTEGDNFFLRPDAVIMR